jgi:hypothetical protein
MDYITKHERSEQDSMWEDNFTSTKSFCSNAMSYLLHSVKNRQVGAVEAADRLLGYKLYSKSRQTRFADLQSIDKVKRVLKSATEIAAMLKVDPELNDIFQPHWVLDITCQRGSARQCCKGHVSFLWEKPIFDPSQQPNPLSYNHKNLHD